MGGKEKKIGKAAINYIVIFLLFLLAVKKGGFYKTDSLLIELLIVLLGVGYMIGELIICKKKNTFPQIELVEGLLFVMPICYTLPILFSQTANMADSITEVIRWFCVAMLYHVVRKTGNKKILGYGMIGIAIVLCMIGIDGLGCRVLSPILNTIESGFLTKDFTRMSSTIQYANVFAIGIAMAAIVVWNAFLPLLEGKNKGKQIVFYYVILTLFLSCIVLSGSRSVQLLTGIAMAAILVLHKERKYGLVVGILTGIVVLLSTTVISHYQILYPACVYILFAISFVFFGFLGYGMYRFFQMPKGREGFDKHSRVYTSIGIAMGVLYVVVGIFWTKPLTIEATEKQETITRQLYEIQTGENNISFHVQEQENAKYRIVLYETKQDFSGKEIHQFQYYDTVTGNFTYTFSLQEDVKNLTLYMVCEQGKIEVSQMQLNGKSQALSYTIIPDDILIRGADILHGSTSMRDRISYLKDAIAILTATPMQCVFGNGGGAFAALYPSVQTLNYTSTEVHNGYVQIMVESGILGGLIGISILVVKSIQSKFSVCTIVVLLLVIHIALDLALSYFLMMAVLAILLAILPVKKEKYSSNRYSGILLYIVCIGMGSFLSVELLFQNIAYQMEIPKYEKEELTLAKQQQVVSLLEKRTHYDRSERAYRKSLQEGYVELLELEENPEQVKQILMKIENNIQQVLVQNKALTQKDILWIEGYHKRLEGCILEDSLPQFSIECRKIQQLVDRILNGIALEERREEVRIQLKKQYVEKWEQLQQKTGSIPLQQLLESWKEQEG